MPPVKPDQSVQLELITDLWFPSLLHLCSVIQTEPTEPSDSNIKSSSLQLQAEAQRVSGSIPTETFSHLSEPSEANRQKNPEVLTQISKPSRWLGYQGQNLLAQSLVLVPFPGFFTASDYFCILILGS